MNVIFNNETREYDDGTTLAVLVKEYRTASRANRVGAWVNQKLVRAAAYEKTVIHEGDRISVRKLAGGG